VKRVSILIMILMMLMVSASLFAGMTWNDVRIPVGQILGVVLTVLGTPLLIKLGRKWGLDISDSQAEAAIDALINILVNLEFSQDKTDPITTKRLGVFMAQQQLPTAMQKALVTKYGSMEAAVQVAFERSSLNQSPAMKERTGVAK